MSAPVAPPAAGAHAPFCRILGPTEVEIDGVPADLGGPRTRHVLALLSTGGGDPVPDDHLLDLIWRNKQRRQAVQALRAIVNRLRAGLGPEVGHRYLLRGRGGYALTFTPEQTDHGRFSALIAQAQRHLADDSAAAAARDFAAAVTLWRGAPWEELGDVPELAGPRIRLGELYETAVEELQAARLTLGDTASATAALTHAVEAAPYRERRWELLALALYRSGRQTEALAALQRIGHRLRAETGTDPGPALRALEHRILHQDSALLAPSFATALAGRIPVVGRLDEVGQESPALTVLRIELHPGGGDDPGDGGRGDKVIQVHGFRYQVDTCRVDPRDPADMVRRFLQAGQYDIVSIDSAIRFSSDSLLLDTIVNLAHSLQPHCRFAFGCRGSGAASY